MTDFSSYIDGMLAISGMLATLVLGGWTVISQSDTMSASQTLDGESGNFEPVKKAA